MNIRKRFIKTLEEQRGYKEEQSNGLNFRARFMYKKTLPNRQVQFTVKCGHKKRKVFLVWNL